MRALPKFAFRGETARCLPPPWCTARMRVVGIGIGRQGDV